VETVWICFSKCTIFQLLITRNLGLKLAWQKKPGTGFGCKKWVLFYFKYDLDLGSWFKSFVQLIQKISIGTKRWIRNHFSTCFVTVGHLNWLFTLLLLPAMSFFSLLQNSESFLNYEFFLRTRATGPAPSAWRRTRASRPGPGTWQVNTVTQIIYLEISVADPDPYVSEPPGSWSISTRTDPAPALDPPIIKQK
jgi:hypothetical protein